MSRFVADPHQGEHLYDLFGVVNHYGSMVGGHYTSYVKGTEGGKSSLHTVMRTCNVQ